MEEIVSETLPLLDINRFATDGGHLTYLISSLNFQNGQNFLLNITFIFNGCQFSLATVTNVTYEHYSLDLTYILFKQKSPDNSMNLMNGAFIFVTPDTEPTQLRMMVMEPECPGAKKRFRS